MTYEQFIDELRDFRRDGEALLSDANHETAGFRKWWHGVRSTMQQASELGFRLPGTVNIHRHFQAMWVGASPENEAQAFGQGMQDTLMELRHIVTQYEKYGDPGVRFAQPSKETKTSAPAAGDQTINIHGNVGAVQTGPHATAHVNLDATNLQPLIDALVQLRAEVSKGDALLPTEERQQSLDVIDQLVVAAKAPKPNKFALSGLARGLSDSIRTANAIPGAWHAVKAAALHLFGLHLP